MKEREEMLCKKKRLTGPKNNEVQPHFKKGKQKTKLLHAIASESGKKKNCLCPFFLSFIRQASNHATCLPVKFHLPIKKKQKKLNINIKKNEAPLYTK